MRRWAGGLLTLGVVLMLAGAGPKWATAQLPLGRVIIDHASSVLHVAIVQTVGSSVIANIGHASSVLHVAIVQPIGSSVIANLGHVSAAVHVAGFNVTPRFTVYQVRGCGIIAREVVGVASGRRDMIIQNAGSVNVYIGGPHVSLSASTGFALHASSASPVTSRVLLPNFIGDIYCIADGPNQTLEVIQMER